MKPSGPCSLFSAALALSLAARTQHNTTQQKRFPKEAVKRSGGGELPKPEACELRPCEWAGAEILRLVPSNRNLKTTGLDEDGPPEVLTCCFAPSVSPPAEGTVARTGWNWPAQEERRNDTTTFLPSSSRDRGAVGVCGAFLCQTSAVDRNVTKIKVRGDET